MYYYKFENKEIISSKKIEDLERLETLNFSGEILYLYHDASKEASGIELIHSANFLELDKHRLEDLLKMQEDGSLLEHAIREKRVIAINTAKLPYDYQSEKKTRFKVNVLGLGDVGGMMLSALRLLGGDTITEIGIFDLDENKVKRWLYELNQIKTIDRGPFPPVVGVGFEEVFDCDVFIFTASAAIPEVGSGVKDVRMYQLESNSKIISIYAKTAKERGFKGQFVVVSDPVDLLCKVVHNVSELRPEQIKGFGLGVMNARAAYYSETYEPNGRVFGPHGKLLVVADDVYDYNHEESLVLTKKTIEANLDVRAVGYKPFIAPALSSAALSILAYLEGKPHYATTFVDGAYFGCRQISKTLELNIIEQNIFDEQLFDRLVYTHKELREFEF